MICMKLYWFLIFLILSVMAVNAQNYPMNPGNNGQTFYTCSGTFVDNGGISGIYGHNIVDRTITFCSNDATQHLRLDFTIFQTQQNFDILEVFYGPTITGAPAYVLSGNQTGLVIVSDQPGGCLSFRFNSNASVAGAGWLAEISCAIACSPPVAVLTELSQSICRDTGGYIAEFDASGSYATDSFGVKYHWTWGDGTTSVTTTPITQHTYTAAGFYDVMLQVESLNGGFDTSGCFSNQVTHRVKALPQPIFVGTSGNQTVACGGTVNLTGVASSQTIVTLPPAGEGSSFALPDNSSGYESSIDLTGYFPIGAVVTSSCLPKITLNIEHSFVGDIKVFLTSPSGQQITILDGYGDGSFSSNNLGSVKLGYCVREATNGVPGCPAPYHIVNSGGLLWANAGSRHNLTQPCTFFSGPCESGSYFRQNQNFNSSQPLTGLVGSPLNGVWKLRIVDYWSIDDGFLESWSIEFPPQCYREMEIITPQLTDAVWSHNGSGAAVPVTQQAVSTPYNTLGVHPCPAGFTCTGNRLTNTIQLGPFHENGTHTYTYTVTDEFGCTYVRDVVVTVNAGTITFTELESSYCKGDPPDALPTTSSNGVVGTWEPDTVNTAAVGQTTYTFTPSDQTCAGTFDHTIQVTQPDITPINYN